LRKKVSLIVVAVICSNYLGIIPALHNSFVDVALEKGRLYDLKTCTLAKHSQGEIKYFGGRFT